jgi:dTDP-4-amino-4,6-dideoxygalactose transaminase
MASKKTSQAQPDGLPRAESSIIPNQTAVDAGLGVFPCPTWPPADPEFAERIGRLLASGDWGRYFPAVVEELRGLIAAELTVNHVRLVCSGSAAIELALRACLGENALAGRSTRPGAGAEAANREPAEVICSVLDYPGNARAVRLLGALPVLVDTLPDRWTIDPAAVERAATSRTVAVLVSHLYGEIAELPALTALCQRQGWALIEDVCQVPGASLDGKLVGTFGNIAAWSFGGSKPLTAGCGGAVTTQDDLLAQRLAAYCDRPSHAYPLSPLQSAVLIPQWQRLSQWVEVQNTNLARLIETLAVRTPTWIWPAPRNAGQHRVHYKIPIRLAAESSPACGKRVAGLIELANRRGIPAGEPFRIPGKLAPSRGRIASSAEAVAITTRSWLIDHRILAGDPASRVEIAERLIELHDTSAAWPAD